MEQDFVPGLERDLGNARAHGSGPDDADHSPIESHGQIDLKPSNGWRQAVQ
jgi:hypothetical protein